MKRFSTFVCVLLAQGACLAALADNWKPFHPPKSHFKVSLPGKPVTAGETHSDASAGKFYMAAHTLKTTGLAYQIVETEFDRKFVGTPSSMLKGVEYGFGQSTQATLVSGKEVKFQGYVAREMMFKKGALRFRGLTLNVDHFNLAFMVIGDEKNVKSADANKFFKSIKIIK